MQKRPTFIDLRSKSSDTMRTGTPSPRAFPSPRMQHLAGDIPPTMSPLDMFAAQSRLLAKQLDDSKRGDRRVSRLPPLTTTDPITKQQSMYNRSRSVETRPTESGLSPRARDEEPSGIMPEVEEPDFRPKSFYPRMSTVPPAEEDNRPMSFYPRMSTVPAVEDDEDRSDLVKPSPEDQPFLTPAEFQPVRTTDYFGVPRAKSPESSLPNGRGTEVTEQNQWVFPPRSQEPIHPFSEPDRGLSIESTSSRGYNSSLAPPKSPHIRQAASVRSATQDSSDEELSASTGGSGFSRNRKLSSSSGVSMPHSPLSPFAQAHNRSPSLNSEYSIGGSQLARPTFNFSRPLSRASKPSGDMTSRQPSFDSRPSFDAVQPPIRPVSRQDSSDSQRFIFVDDTVQTPISMDNEQFFDSKDAPAPSYIYTKYSLPRGRVLQRDSRVLENKQMPLFEWERPAVQSNVRPTTPLANRPYSPTPSPLRSPKPSMELHRSSPRPSIERRPKSSPRPSTEQISRVSSATSAEQSRLHPNRPAHTPIINDDQSEYSASYSASTRSGSTIKARSHHPAPMSVELTAEDHLAKGILLHERGEDKESTYHLRIAARQNLPTAMLLYALACRHGWGMRPNQQEGVQWLRKAADFASLEIAIDEDPTAKPSDVLERKTRRAQFALSIYELGVSHMNGWGIEQDKTLALRCFEIAANWGDADAMAETGFCYAEGQGCKKDLRKAAKYYKMAEARGMSMVGNSWYVIVELICQFGDLLINFQDPQSQICRRRRQASTQQQ